jgi:menaquinone-dependent protoporphyrinogen oxidase
MTRFLIVHATHDGQTGRIADRIAAALAGGGRSVRSHRLGGGEPPAPQAFDAVIAGGCVRYGRHDRALVDFLRRHADTLARRTTGVFSVDLISLDPAKTQPAGNVYLRKLLGRIGFRPDAAEAFAGRLDYPRYRWFDRWMIRMIMRAMGGPTDPSAVVEYTDFDAVDRFAARMLKLSNRSAQAPASMPAGS